MKTCSCTRRASVSASTYTKLLKIVIFVHALFLVSSFTFFGLFMSYRIRLTSNLIFWFFYPFSSCVIVLELALLTWGLVYVEKTGKTKHQAANVFWGYFFVVAYIVELGLSKFTKLEPNYGPLVIPFDNGTQIHWFTREKTPSLVEISSLENGVSQAFYTGSDEINDSRLLTLAARYDLPESRIHNIFVPLQNFSFRTSAHSAAVDVAVPSEITQILITSDEHAVRRRVRQFQPSFPFDLHLMVGDMSESGMLQEFDDEFQGALGHSRPRLLVHGNHDELFQYRKLN